MAAAWTWLCLPELRNRSREEIDELFETRLPAWRFKDYQATGLAGAVRALGQGEGGKGEEHYGCGGGGDDERGTVGKIERIDTFRDA